MNKFKIAVGAAASAGLMAFSSLAFAAVVPPTFPTEAQQCKKDGWRNYGQMFKNQGDCVSFVVTEGRNEPDGPPIH